jgi:phytoene dehydrogenase-like protein
MLALRSATALAHSRFQGTRARGLFAGLAAHSFLRIDRSPSAAIGLVLALLGHSVGWPIARGGSQSIIHALSSTLCHLNGTIRVDSPVQSLDGIDPNCIVMLDLTPRQIIEVAGNRLSPRYRRQLRRYRYGPGVFKVDWALDGPVPWRAGECHMAGTVHLGATIEEIALSEHDVHSGRHPERPFVLIAQQSLFDPTRAPDGKHTLWGYCHVPNGSTVDMTSRIEGQIERFAPGFTDRILARSVMGPSQFEQYNANYIGGDINGGIQDLRQLFTRPAIRIDPYATSDPATFICSSSTPPGGGVHGMSGYHAARSVLRRMDR